MADYQKMYLTMFTAAESAIGMIDANRPMEAVRGRLLSALRRAEELYVNSTADGADGEAERDARIREAFNRLTSEEMQALDWVAKHWSLAEKVSEGEPLTRGEMDALIGATADLGVYPLYFLHECRTKINEQIALMAAAAQRAAREKGGA